MPQHSAIIHSVQIYDEHSALISRLSGIVASGLQIGNSVLIVATAQHRTDLTKALENAGMSLRAHAREGRFTMLDAKETLATFMVDGHPNRDLFEVSVGSLLREAKKAARGKEQGLTVFGEMVAVLWDEGNKTGALELEALWNDVLNDRAFHLHCAYPRWGFVDHQAKDLDRICDSHSHVLLN